MSKKPLIIANWKMNLTLKQSEELAAAIVKSSKKQKLSASCDMVICPAATALGTAGNKLKDSDVSLGAQDCHFESQGAHTGDISADMLSDIGVSHVIVGHSERRDGHFETNDQVKRKAEAAHKAGLVSIICVGEPIDMREKGDDEAEKFVINQMNKSVPEGATEKNTVIAYEPVWAIGTGRTPTTEQIKEMHKTISETMGEKFRVIYGGSLNAKNAGKILSINGVDGGLIGGASLKSKDFCKVASFVEKAKIANGR